MSKLHVHWHVETAIARRVVKVAVMPTLVVLLKSLRVGKKIFHR